jgi:hypothetical protein
MNAHQTERAAYMAAHAIISANTSAPELACPGARRSHAVDVIASIIKDVLALHCGELDAFTDWSHQAGSCTSNSAQENLHLHADSAVTISS